MLRGGQRRRRMPTSPRTRWASRKRSPLPKGAGGVHCLLCGARAAADGRGTPIVLHHKPGCLEGRLVLVVVEGDHGSVFHRQLMVNHGDAAVPACLPARGAHVSGVALLAELDVRKYRAPRRPCGACWGATGWAQVPELSRVPWTRATAPGGAQ